jgi:acyl carrier protein
MEEAKIAAFAIGIAAVCGLVVVQQISTKRRLKSILASRERILAAEFGSRYYTDATKAEIATFILQKIEEITGYDFTGALPSDHWTGDLHIDQLDSQASVEILHEVEQRFGIAINNAEAKQVKTLGDFVELVSSKTNVTRRPSSATPHE